AAAYPGRRSGRDLAHAHLHQLSRLLRVVSLDRLQYIIDAVDRRHQRGGDSLINAALKMRIGQSCGRDRLDGLRRGVAIWVTRLRQYLLDVARLHGDVEQEPGLFVELMLDHLARGDVDRVVYDGSQVEPPARLVAEAAHVESVGTVARAFPKEQRPLIAGIA